MVTKRILDASTARAVEVARDIIDIVNQELGYEASEAVPGLLMAAVALCDRTADPDQALTEASYLLSGMEIEDVMESLGEGV